MPAQNSKGTILLFHGHASSKSYIVREADYFHELGFNTLAMDVRSHGNSQGNVCTVGFKETEGIKLAYDWVMKKSQIPFSF
ncbi:MAG: alpha/beta hydrolase [Arcicella sp.]|nr:alpha/beta hydrolase [Arcicella sp.]